MSFRESGIYLNRFPNQVGNDKRIAGMTIWAPPVRNQEITVAIKVSEMSVIGLPILRINGLKSWQCQILKAEFTFRWPNRN